MDLRVCLDEGLELYQCMGRRSRSVVGPLQGKGLVWRRHMIQFDLGPRMERIAKNLRTLERQAIQTTKRLRKGANESAGQVCTDPTALLL
ncbi:hypothetical protein A1O1_07916 [Capronia coronata CBS 617.96]|uniref:Uncharacterized protein n=1 Tax=Capronia coronata CBS 617.96 TaxID=1182541 RepID=W9XY47_9EURO|nr:uncharacterized protein A1O1_07916 [Capronia coronata CBS 617.96]EXJ81851.1 hypothetical protein A1O1_07916 [Capronia coronata CBS 617.96]